MPNSIPCPECKNDIPQPATCCPHCGRPGYFWNVIHASADDERGALESRYKSAKADALTRGADAVVEDFENAAAGSVAVIARSDTDLHRLANSTRQLYATYYQQIEAGLRLPDADEWNAAREIADTILFPNFKEQMRFAALSLDGVGLATYGSCSFTLRDDMISHRASVFDENSVIFMERHGVKASRKPNVPKGFRAIWSERGKVCTAKLAERIDSATSPNQYSSLLLKQGATPEDDEFVEVHIFGPITILSMETVSVTTPKARQRAIIVRALKSKLAKYGITVN